MPDHLLLVLGERDGRPLCAALDVFDGATLWGRYWGTRDYVPGLHFEACYYQAIEFCIERRITRFEGGAQGVHKLARGLLPITTSSAHAIADPDFAAAIAEFCARERSDSRTSSTSSRRRARSATARCRPHARLELDERPRSPPARRCRRDADVESSRRAQRP